MAKDERREHPRAQIHTCITLCLGPDELGVFRVVDLSASGALLEGRCPIALGQEVTARMHFAPFEVMVTAHAVREAESDEGPSGWVFAIQFALMAPEVRECVRSLVESNIAWSNEPTRPLPLRSDLLDHVNDQVS
jgi:hypothetical protein